MKLAEFSVKHSLFVNLLSIFLVCAGLVSLFKLRREAFPQVSFDVVVVTTLYPGATAEEVERLVTTPLEKELKEVDDIEEMSSVSREGVSTIVLKLEADVKNKRKVVDDIQTAVDRVDDLPRDAEKPIVNDITSKNFPVIIVAVSGEVAEKELQEAARDLEDKILDIEGVARVDRRGFRDREFWVEVDLDKMASCHVSYQEIKTALKKHNIGLSAGNIETKTSVFSVKTSGEFYTAEEIENVIIRSNDAGVSLRIKDVAKVIDTFEEENILNRVEGARAISLVVIKKEKGDAIRIVKEIRKIIKEERESLSPRIKINTFYDLSFYIKRRLNVLYSNGIIGFLLILGSLFFFLHLRPAIFTALGVPVALLTTLWIMSLLDMSINLITMFGLIVVLGMLVDDGIIIAENIYRYLEKGYASKKAAIVGTSEVIKPVLTTVLTTIAAFTPLIFMSGLIGRFMRAIPLVVCLALSASLLEAFIILPSHMADFLHPIKSVNSSRRKSWRKFTSRYVHILNKALKYRYRVCFLVMVLFIGAVLVAYRFMPFILFSGRGVEQFMIRAEAEPGTSLQKTLKLIKPVEKLVENMPRQYIDTYATRIGIMQEERGYDPGVKQGRYLAQITVYLTPSQKRKKTAADIINEYRDELSQIKGFKRLYFRKFREGPPVGKPVYLKVRGDDYKIINKIVREVKKYLSSLKGVSDIVDDYQLGNKELRIRVHPAKAAKAYLTVSEVAEAIKASFAGAVVTSIKPTRAEEEIDVRLRLLPEQRNSREIFNKLLVSNSYGNLIPLNKIAYIKEVRSLQELRHLNGIRFVSVSAEVDNKNITSRKVNFLLKKKFKNISLKYPGYSIHYGGEHEETVKSMKSLFVSFLLAFLLIFMILSTEFNSLIQPFVVMMSIPFSIIGVVIALILHHEPISFFVILGLVGLSGVVVNDSIVFMDFINTLRREGKEVIPAVLEAGKVRLRPVILTTLTTFLGISTVAYGIGGKDPFLQPMALTIAWGLFFATFLTLILMPCIYVVVEDIKSKIKKQFLGAKLKQDNKKWS